MRQPAPRLTVDFGYLEKSDGGFDMDEYRQVVAVLEGGSVAQAQRLLAREGVKRDWETISASWRRFRNQARRSIGDCDS